MYAPLPSSGDASEVAYSYTVPLTRIYQNTEESYTEFKARLQIYQYGVYEDAFGKQTVVLYLGNMGSDGLRYSDLNANFAYLDGELRA